MCARNRLLEFIEYKRISKRQFYIHAGLSSGFLTKNKNIGSDKIKKIISAYPELRVEWVIMGTGNMICDSVDKRAKNERHKFLPLVDISTVAKEPEITYDDEGVEILDSFFLGRSYTDCKVAVQVWGDGMRPEFCPGDIAILRKVVSMDYVQWGFAHLLITKEQQFFRRVQRSSDVGKLRLLGNQLEDESFDIKKDDISVIYEVRAMVRKLMT